MVHYTVETKLSVQEAVNALESELKSEQFGVLWQFDIQGKLIEKGFDFPGAYVVLEVCNPAEANRVLQETPLAGYFLPCKIVVYETQGKVSIGMLRPTALISIMQNDVLQGIAADIEARLVSCIDRAVESRDDK